ncbi:hypothetical protein Tco_1254909 [Tanacetum coccineum]
MYTINSSFGLGATSRGSSDNWCFNCLKAYFASGVQQKSLFLMHFFKVLSSGKDFSADLEWNLFKLANFPLRLWTSLIVRGDGSYSTTSVLSGHGFIPSGLIMYPKNIPSTAPNTPASLGISLDDVTTVANSSGIKIVLRIVTTHPSTRNLSISWAVDGTALISRIPGLPIMPLYGNHLFYDFWSKSWLKPVLIEPRSFDEPLSTKHAVNHVSGQFRFYNSDYFVPAAGLNECESISRTLRKL